MRLWMRLSTGGTIALLSIFLLRHGAAADVRVTFVNSFHYSDATTKSPTTRETTLTEIRATLQALGARYLGAGDVLKIEVLDIAPLGMSVQPTPAPPSQMDIQYVLQRHGKTVLEDRETLSDVGYLEKPNVHPSKDPLVYEKEMLSDWFVDRFGGLKPPN